MQGEKRTGQLANGRFMNLLSGVLFFVPVAARHAVQASQYKLQMVSC